MTAANKIAFVIFLGFMMSYMWYIYSLQKVVTYQINQLRNFYSNIDQTCLGNIQIPVDQCYTQYNDGKRFYQDSQAGITR